MKKAIVEQFWQDVRARIPLPQAQVVTLGGEGLEAKIWEQQGVPPKQGWLIERGRESRDRLLQQFPFRHHRNLHTFTNAFQSIHGKKQGVDALHADFCGTIEPKIDEVLFVTPLLWRAKTRMLAITVADARRNRSLENFSRVEQRAQTQLGTAAAQSFLDHLRSEQQTLACFTQPNGSNGFSPEKGAQRELGLFVEFLKIVKTRGGWRLPISIKRYVYVSHYRGSFRMRTYCFQFSDEVGPLHEVVERWKSSPLYQGQAEKIILVSSCTPLTSATTILPKRENRMSHEKLRQVAMACGGEIQAEFESLLARAQSSEVSSSALAKIAAVFQEVTSTPLSPAQSTLAPVSPRTKPKEKTDKPNHLSVQMKLLRAKTQGDDALEEAYKDATQLLGLNRGRQAKSARRTLGALLAHTQGRFRRRFVAHTIEAFGEEVLTELAELYSIIDGKPVTADELRAESNL